MRSVTPQSPCRRLALKQLAGLIAAATISPLSAKPPMTKPLHRPIPKTGELLPAVGLGTWQTFDVSNDPEGRAACRETLRLFAEAGGRVIDSSPMYGSSETMVGDLSAELGVRPSLFIATKVWTNGRQSGIDQMETSAARLRTKQIDLMQVHNLVDLQTHMRTLRQWKDEGRIRYWGFTHYTVSAHHELAELVKKERPDFVQFNYSIATTDAERELFPVAAAHNTAVLINRPFEGAALFQTTRGKPLPPWAKEIDCESWAQFFLKYIISHPAVTCAIPGTRNPKHLADNLRGAVGRLPDEKTRQKMVDYFGGL